MPVVPATGACWTRRPSASSKWAISMRAPSLWAAKSWPGPQAVEVSAKDTLAGLSPAARTGPKTTATATSVGAADVVPSVSRGRRTTPSVVP